MLEKNGFIFQVPTLPWFSFCVKWVTIYNKGSCEINMMFIIKILITLYKKC